MASAIDSSDTVYTAQRLHDLSATASAALGRLLTAASVMGAMQKQEHATLTLRINGGGPIGTVTVISDSHGKKNRGCTKYKTIPNDYRLSIDRSCLSFKRTYALRTECERYNSRFKCTGQERLWVHNSVSATNLNTIAHISALAIACAAILLPGTHSYRSKKALRRAA